MLRPMRVRQMDEKKETVKEKGKTKKGKMEKSVTRERTGHIRIYI